MVSSVFAAAIAASAVQMATARPADASINVVGGTDAPQDNEVPFIVAMQNQGRFFCGGSLVNSQFVVTAAHCVASLQNTQGLSVRVGSLSPKTGGTVVPVTSAVVHPQFDPKRINNDVAVLKLAQPLDANQPLRFASLPQSGSDPAAGTQTVVHGWGALKENGGSPPTLQRVELPVVDRAQCQQANRAPGGPSVNDNMFCAGLPEGGKDSCQGDSGGPIIDADGTLIGVVSFGQGCARPNKFGIYTRLGKYVDFITQTMAENGSNGDSASNGGSGSNGGGSGSNGGGSGSNGGGSGLNGGSGSNGGGSGLNGPFGSSGGSGSKGNSGSNGGSGSNGSGLNGSGSNGSGSNGSGSNGSGSNGSGSNGSGSNGSGSNCPFGSSGGSGSTGDSF